MEKVKELEDLFGKIHKVDHVVGCSSGTAALHLALESLQLPPGSKVAVPNYTMVAVPRAVILAGLTPVFIGCNSDLLINWMNVGCVENVKAVIVVHTYGRKKGIPSNPEQYGLHIIEDMAELHGFTPSPWSSASCWSFYKNKVIAGEEGGAVGYWKPEYANRAKELRCLGFTEKHDYTHSPRGHNYRLSNVHADLILQSMGNMVSNIFERRRIESYYDEFCPQGWKMPYRDSVWVYDLYVPNLPLWKQDVVVERLNREGIPARHGFKPMTWQEEFRDCEKVGYDHSEKMVGGVFYLPCRPGIDTYKTAKEAFQIITEELTSLPVFGID